MKQISKQRLQELAGIKVNKSKLREEDYPLKGNYYRILNHFKKEITDAASDPHDIVSAYEEIIDKYNKHYPIVDWEEEFNNFDVEEYNNQELNENNSHNNIKNLTDITINHALKKLNLLKQYYTKQIDYDTLKEDLIQIEEEYNSRMPEDFRVDIYGYKDYLDDGTMYKDLERIGSSNSLLTGIVDFDNDFWMFEQNEDVTDEDFDYALKQWKEKVRPKVRKLIKLGYK